MTKEEILKENQELKLQLNLLEEKNQRQEDRIYSLMNQLNAILKLMKGSKSERYIPDSLQGNLFGDPTPATEVVEQKIESHTRKKKKHPGRKPLPDHLEVEEIILEPEVDLASGEYERIGEEVSDTLHYVKAELKIIRRIRPKYVKKDKENPEILIAELPSRPVPKCIAEISLIVQLMIGKFVDHLPFYRQRQIFKRDFKYCVSESTLNDWYKAHVEVLRPIYYLIRDKILAEGYIQVDETPLKVLDKNKKKDTHQGYMWVYHAPLICYVFYDYRKGRGMHGPKQILREYLGYVQCDGYTVYDKIGKRQEGIKLIGCFAHVRRKFVDALDYDERKAGVALEAIGKLYLLDREDDRAKARKAQKEIWDELISWVEKESIIVVPKSSLGKALRYLIGQREKLERILTETDLRLDNNLIENKIRPLALGRKNFLFAGSHAGAERMAIMETILCTCKALNINPRSYLETVLERISDHPINKLEQLLPDKIKM